MKWVVYNLLFATVYPLLLPGFLLRMLRRGGYANRFWDRFALYPEGLFGKNRPLFDSHALPTANCQLPTANFVWIHAVSVGEVQVAGQLMREWRKAEPSVRFCFSTTSSTGWRIAKVEVSEKDVLIYNPLDFPNFVKSALRTVRPRAIVLTESEIWPNFILQAKKMEIPVFLINARVSDRSAPRYKAAKWFFGDVLSAFTRIFAQSDLDKARLVAAGAPEAKVEVTGSFKFDVAHRNEAKEKELREWIFPTGTTENAESAKILLGGSTWPGEDEVLLKIYKNLRSQISDFRSRDSDCKSCGSDRKSRGADVVLVLAPRHFEKADAVEANIRKAGFACVRRSRGEGRKTEDGRLEGETRDGKTVFLADTTGELMGLYGIADVVFVGKSLCEHGSQNMIEPCLCGKPTFVGPYTENFRPVMSDLLAADAIVQVKDANELERGIVAMLSPDSGDRNVAAPSWGTAEVGAATFLSPLELGARAKAAVEKRLGVVTKCVAEIRGAL